MMLPPKQAKKPKRSSRWRSQKHLMWIRSFHCSMPGCNGMPIEAAHVRLGSGAGMGQKPSDWRAVPLCRTCHDSQHSQGEDTFWRAYKAITGKTVDELIDALCDASPRRLQIREARNGA